MAQGGREPTDGPETGRTAGEQGVAFMAELSPVEGALAPATFTDEYALLLCHSTGGNNTGGGGVSHLGS